MRVQRAKRVNKLYLFGSVPNARARSRTESNVERLTNILSDI